MVKRLTLVFILSIFVMLMFAGGTFATTAKKVSADGKQIRHVSEDAYPSDDANAITSPGRYSAAGSKDESDCLDLIPDPEVPAATEHDLVGSTWYEFQKNGSMGRMISVTSAGTGGYRHVSWMWTAGVYPGGQRRVYARTKAAAWQATAQEVGLGTVNSGYSNQTHLNDGTSVVIFHRTGLGGNWCYMAVADGPAASPLYTRKWDLPDDMPEAPSTELGAWPKCEVLYCTDTTVHANPLNYFHIIENEGNTVGGAENRVGYMRCYISPTNGDTLYCQTPTTGGEIYAIKDNTAFQDEVYSFGSSCDISATAVTGRGIVGKRVAIPYLPLASAGTCDYLSDAAYMECMDNGDAWIDGTDWPPTTHRLTNFGTTGSERAYHDMSACYDYEDSLHIVYVTAGFDPTNPGYYQPGVARLYHWSKENGTSIIGSRIQEGANPASHNVNLSKPSISPKDPIYHPGDSTYLFCIWTAVDTSDQNAAGDQGNQDLYGSGSFDGGNTWGKVLNLTGTHTPGCVAGACVSEHWPSMATNMLGGDLHIEYICDRDPGGAIMDEGTWTENYVFYMRVPEWQVEAGPRGEYRLEEPIHWYHPPIKVVPNQTRTITFKLFSIGNEALTYSVSSDNPCVQVSVPPTQLNPKDSVQISVLIDGTGACNGTFIAGNVVLSTDEAGGTVQNLRVHAVVSSEYYECPRDPETFDTLENDYIQMYTNANCMQWIYDIGLRPDTTFEVFFQGGTIVATTSGGDTLVGRHMGDNDIRSGAQDKLYREECTPSWEYPFTILFTKEIYIEAAHLLPPNHFKWFWWEIAKQVKFFNPPAPEYYQRMVIKYVKVKRQDPPGWWPDLTPFTNYEDTYIGFAMDIDAPYDSSGGPEPGLGDESACNYGRYDATNDIAYQVGFGRTGEHPEYNDYHAGIALADVNGVVTTAPYGVDIVKNNQYLYPTSPWGWIDGQLYTLAATPGTYIQDGPATPDSVVDRSIVMTAHKIDAGTNANAKAEFTVVEVLAPDGLAQMQEYVDTARAVVARERTKGLPAACGDVNGDYVVNVGDIVYLVTYLYKGGAAPLCPIARGDANNDGVINVGDVVYLVTFAYKNGPQPKCPGIWYW
jgi:hypothetical protein